MRMLIDKRHLEHRTQLAAVYIYIYIYITQYYWNTHTHTHTYLYIYICIYIYIYIYTEREPVYVVLQGLLQLVLFLGWCTHNQNRLSSNHHPAIRSEHQRNHNVLSCLHRVRRLLLTHTHTFIHSYMHTHIHMRGNILIHILIDGLGNTYQSNNTSAVSLCLSTCT